VTRASRNGVVPYPAEFAARYRAARMWGRRTIGQELRASARRHPLAVAVVDSRRRVTYRELDRRTEVLAASLLEQGLRPGDAVLLQLGNRVETVEVWYGLIKAGLIPICTLPQHGHHEIDVIAALAQARAHVVEVGLGTRDAVRFGREAARAAPTLRTLLTVGGSGGDGRIEDLAEAIAPARAAARVAEAEAALEPDGLAVLQLSGGTTGTPKLIPRLHAEYWYNAVATARRWGLGPDDRVAQVLPVVHNAGIHGALHASHSVGAALLLASADPDLFMPFLARERATTLFLVPGVAGSLLQRRDVLPALRHMRRLSLAGAAVSPELFANLSALGVNVLQHFGMGEGICTAMPTDAPRGMRMTTVGYPLSELDEVRIVDPETGTDAAAGEPGELWARGPYTIRGYYKAPDRNAVAFSPDGFYKTGDLAVAVPVGATVCYRHVGRIKDLINRGGEKISAEEVELVLAGHPGIRAAAVVAMPDERLGERSCAFVVPATPGAVDLDGIRAFLAHRDVARYKWPERLELVERFPTTPLGKVSKAVLRDDIAARLKEEVKATHANR